MRKLSNQTLKEFYQYDKKYFFKACGLRTFNAIENIHADLIGINFSPISKRKISEENLNSYVHQDNLVAVFKENSYAEILKITEKFNFSYIQFYVNELNLEQIKTIKCKKILAFNPNVDSELNQALKVAKYIDFFILDGSIPGSGTEISLEKAVDFPYPFLLAGGINANNLHKINNLPNCIGIDSASGVETLGEFDVKKVDEILGFLISFAF